MHIYPVRIYAHIYIRTWYVKHTYALRICIHIYALGILYLLTIYIYIYALGIDDAFFNISCRVTRFLLASIATSFIIIYYSLFASDSFLCILLKTEIHNSIVTRLICPVFYAPGCGMCCLWHLAVRCCVQDLVFANQHNSRSRTNININKYSNNQAKWMWMKETGWSTTLCQGQKLPSINVKIT